MKLEFKTAFIKSFLKKYSALVLPGGLLIAALVLFIPTMWIGGKVSAKMDESERMARELDSLISQAPPTREAEQVKEQVQQLEKQAQTIETMAVQSSQRELIRYGIFPKPAETSSQLYLDFGREYRRAMMDLVENRLQARDAPSEAEIRTKTGFAGGAAYAGGGYPGAMGGPSGIRTGEVDPVVDALCLSQAQKMPVYANPKLFAWYDFWESYTFSTVEQALQDCWHSQIAFWIYEDVAASIASLNQGSAQVSSSPVKRLLGVSFQKPVSGYAVSAGGMPMMGGQMPGRYMGMGQSATGDQPAYVTAGLTSPLVPESLTGRITDTETDVVHFAMSVVVDNRYVQAFLKELCSAKPHSYREGFKENGAVQELRHNQIAVLQSSVSAVDRQDPLHLYYRYGQGGAMRLDLVCEYLFNRKGYDSIKPEPIKVLLGQSETSVQEGTGSDMYPGMYMPGPVPGGMPSGGGSGSGRGELDL